MIPVHFPSFIPLSIDCRMPWAIVFLTYYTILICNNHTRGPDSTQGKVSRANCLTDAHPEPDRDPSWGTHQLLMPYSGFTFLFIYSQYTYLPTSLPMTYSVFTHLSIYPQYAYLPTTPLIPCSAATYLFFYSQYTNLMHYSPYNINFNPGSDFLHGRMSCTARLSDAPPKTDIDPNQDILLLIMSYLAYPHYNYILPTPHGRVSCTVRLSDAPPKTDIDPNQEIHQLLMSYIAYPHYNYILPTPPLSFTAMRLPTSNTAYHAQISKPNLGFLSNINQYRLINNSSARRLPDATISYDNPLPPGGYQIRVLAFGSTCRPLNAVPPLLIITSSLSVEILKMDGSFQTLTDTRSKCLKFHQNAPNYLTVCRISFKHPKFLQQTRNFHGAFFYKIQGTFFSNAVNFFIKCREFFYQMKRSISSNAENFFITYRVLFFKCRENSCSKSENLPIKCGELFYQMQRSLLSNAENLFIKCRKFFNENTENFFPKCRELLYNSENASNLTETLSKCVELLNTDWKIHKNSVAFPFCLDLHQSDLNILTARYGNNTNTLLIFQTSCRNMSEEDNLNSQPSQHRGEVDHPPTNDARDNAMEVDTAVAKEMIDKFLKDVDSPVKGDEPPKCTTAVVQTPDGVRSEPPQPPKKSTGDLSEFAPLSVGQNQPKQGHRAQEGDISALELISAREKSLTFFSSSGFEKKCSYDIRIPSHKPSTILNPDRYQDSVFALDGLGCGSIQKDLAGAVPKVGDSWATGTRYTSGTLKLDPRDQENNPDGLRYTCSFSKQHCLCEGGGGGAKVQNATSKGEHQR